MRYQSGCHLRLVDLKQRLLQCCHEREALEILLHEEHHEALGAEIPAVRGFGFHVIESQPQFFGLICLKPLTVGLITLVSLVGHVCQIRPHPLSSKAGWNIHAQAGGVGFFATVSRTV